VTSSPPWRIQFSGVVGALDPVVADVELDLAGEVEDGVLGEGLAQHRPVLLVDAVEVAGLQLLDLLDRLRRLLHRPAA
jgi:hypothetical protein